MNNEPKSKCCGIGESAFYTCRNCGLPFEPADEKSEKKHETRCAVMSDGICRCSKSNIVDEIDIIIEIYLGGESENTKDNFKKSIISLLSDEQERMAVAVEKLKKEAIEENGCVGKATNEGWCCYKHKFADEFLSKAVDIIRSGNKE